VKVIQNQMNKKKIWSQIDQGGKKDDNDKISKKSYKVVARWRKIYKKKVEKWKKDQSFEDNQDNIMLIILVSKMKTHKYFIWAFIPFFSKPF